MEVIDFMPETGISEGVNAPETLMKGMVFKSKVDQTNVVKSYSILSSSTY